LGKLLPFLLLIIGVSSGMGAGLMLKPESTSKKCDAENPCEDSKTATSEIRESTRPDSEINPLDREYVKFNNQFVVPVVSDDKVESLVVLSLSVEVKSGRQEDVYNREPRLRDAFLQQLFDHANMGGFNGAFTNSNNMNVLRRALNETAKKVADDLVLDVLIVDIIRQDV